MLASAWKSALGCISSWWLDSAHPVLQSPGRVVVMPLKEWDGKWGHGSADRIGFLGFGWVCRRLTRLLVRTGSASFKQPSQERQASCLGSDEILDYWTSGDSRWQSPSIC